MTDAPGQGHGARACHDRTALHASTLESTGNLKHYEAGRDPNVSPEIFVNSLWLKVHDTYHNSENRGSSSSIHDVDATSAPCPIGPTTNLSKVPPIGDRATERR